MALCHLFAATDIHKENLIASGEYPVIIDCETMFSCTLASHKNLPSDRHLYASCLLPNDSIRNVLEISPLSARSNVKTNLDIKISPKQRLCNAEFETSKFITENCECEVMLGDQRIEDFTAYSECLIDGMRETFEFILKNRSCILYKIKEYMQEASVRVLLRATASYVVVLKNSWHPDSFFKNEVELDLCKIAETDSDPEILKSELSQIRAGDIPYFSIQFNSTEIIDGHDQKLETLIAQTPQQKVEEQLSDLTPQFIDQSLENLHYAILAYRLRQGGHYIAKGRKFCEFNDLPNKLWLDAIAKPVLDTILEQAIVLQGNLYWRTIGEADQNKLNADLTGTNLYDGISGIALAFHRFSKKLNSERYKIFANKLVKQIIKQIEYDTPTRLGALTGTAGTLWAISFIQNNDQIKLLRVMERELSKLSYCVITQPWKKYAELDYLSGASGSLSMLLKLHELYKNYPLASDIAYICSFIFDKIKEKALVLRNENTLLGFAHGSAGVSAALAEYMIHFVLDDLEAIAIIQSNVQRETSFRSAQGWPYLDGKRPYNSSWCHGTVGFGFSRLRCRSFISSEIFDDDLKIVVQRLGEQRASVGLCHGMMADYHLAKALGEDEDCILSKIRHQINCNGITTDLGLNNFEIVGAMTGMTSLFVGGMLL